MVMSQVLASPLGQLKPYCETEEGSLCPLLCFMSFSLCPQDWRHLPLSFFSRCLLSSTTTHLNTYTSFTMASVPEPLADPLAPSEGAAVPPDHPEVKIEPVPLAGMAAPLEPAPLEQQQLVYPQLVNPAPSQQNTHPVKDVALSLVHLQKNAPIDGESEAHAILGVPELTPILPNEHTNIDATIHIDSIDGAKRLKTTATKYTMKPRDPKRDTSIPFEEMQRLMRVYGKNHYNTEQMFFFPSNVNETSLRHHSITGPIKCLRNRTPKESGKDLKQESIKRKFYRWFPDFDSRFERTPEGWYKPRHGHEEEMQYRAEMRKQDQDELVKKRNDKRSSRKARESICHVDVTAQVDVPEAAGQAIPELGGVAQEVAVQETAAPRIEMI